MSWNGGYVISLTIDSDVIENTDDNGYILLWSLGSGTLNQCIKTTQGPITALKWLHNKENDGRLFLASSGTDGTLHLRSIFSNLICFFLSFLFPINCYIRPIILLLYLLGSEQDFMCAHASRGACRRSGS